MKGFFSIPKSYSMTNKYFKYHLTNMCDDRIMGEGFDFKVIFHILWSQVTKIVNYRDDDYSITYV